MKKHIKKHWPKIVGFTSVAIIAFAAFSSKLPSKEPQVPHIDSISPIQGPEGIVITLTGLGFTTQTDNIAKVRKEGKKEDLLSSGNHLKIEGKIASLGVFSNDGTSLEFKLDLNNTPAAKQCTKKLANQKDCSISVKMVNASGQESNAVHFIVTPNTGAIDTSFTPTPLVATFGWIIGQLPHTAQHQLFFTFDSNTVSQVKAFHLYEKASGASTFSLVATFPNSTSLLAAYTANCGGSPTPSLWKLELCPQFGNQWGIRSALLPIDSYPNGQYDFYVAAVDLKGVERTPSALLTTNIIGRATVISPTANQVTSATPTITYKIPSGVPAGSDYEVNVVDGVTGAFVNSFSALIPDTPTQTENSIVYTPDPLYPNSTLVPGRKYYVEADLVHITFFDGSATTFALPEGTYFTVGN